MAKLNSKKTSVNSKWDARIGEFAASTGKTPEQISEALVTVVGNPSDDALDLLADPSVASTEDIQNALKELNIPIAVFKKNLPLLRGTSPETQSVIIGNGGAGLGNTLISLPALPSDESFLEMLKIGGVLKVEQTEIISAVKSAFANQTGLYKIPEKILGMMEQHALAMEEPCGESFYETQRLLTKSKYGDVLSALKVDGNYVSETRKKEFFKRLDEKLWPSLQEFHKSLLMWQQTWTNGAANPALLMMAITAQQSGTKMPAGIMSPPDTSPIRVSAESFANNMNKVFAGPGIPVARALAHDATRIIKILSDSTLPAQTGSANREDMLKKIGITVGSDIVLAEQNISRYALAIMSYDKITADNELAYLASMLTVGNAIPWDKIGFGKEHTL